MEIGDSELVSRRKTPKFLGEATTRLEDGMEESAAITYTAL